VSIIETAINTTGEVMWHEDSHKSAWFLHSLNHAKRQRELDLIAKRNKVVASISYVNVIAIATL